MRSRDAGARRIGAVLIAAVATAIMLMAAVPAAADTVIGFDGPPATLGGDVGTVYAASPGVLFAPGGVPPVQSGFATQSCGTRVTAWAPTASGPNAVRLVCRNAAELDELTPRLYMAFSTATYQTLSLSVGTLNPDRVMQLIAFDGAGGVLARSAPTAIPVGRMVTMSVSAGTPEIAALMLTQTAGRLGGDVYVDDLRLTDPPFSGPPSFTLSVLGDPAVPVVAGREAAGPELVLYRTNGSLGQVTYAVTGLPAGVTWTAAPSVNGVRVRLSADPTAQATAGPVPVTVTATPVSAATSAAPRSVVLDVTVVPAIRVSRSGTGDLTAPSCAPVLIDYRAYEHAGPARWFVTGLPPGASATIDGQPVASAPVLTDGAAHAAALVLRTSTPLRGPAAITIGITGGPYTGSVRANVVAATFSATVTPAAGRPPESLLPGTRVTISGRGTCAGAGGWLRFGNDAALAPIIAGPGGVLTAEVPRFATSGPLGLVADPGNPGSRVDGPSFTVAGFRDTWGFAFKNYTPSITWANMENAFGKRATNLTVNPCVLFDCTVVTPIPDPWALTLWGIAAVTIGGGTGGACYGISRTVDQMRYGQLSPAAFPPGGETAPWRLTGQGRPSGRLVDHINPQQLGVLSSEALAWYATRAVENRVANDSTRLRREIEAELRAGRFPAIALRDGGTVNRLHVVLAYDLTQWGSDPGSFDVWVYDSNLPFIETERSDATGATHRDRTDRSRLRVNADGSWRIRSTTYGASANSLGNIVVFPDPTLPRQPSLPTAAGVATRTFTYLSHLGSADGGAGTIALAGEAPALTQVTSGDRTLLREDGLPNTDPATALQGVPWAPPTGTDTGVEGAVLLGDGGDDGYRVTSTGGGSRATQAFLGRNLIAQVIGTAPRGAREELEVRPQDGAVTLDTAGAERPVEARVMVRTPDGATLAATAQGVAGGEGAGIAIDPTSGAVTVEMGAGGPVTLRLGTVGPRGPVAVTARLRLGGGERLRIAGSEWRRLRTGRVAYSVGGRRGVLRAQRAAAARPRIAAVVIRGRRPAARVTVRAPRTAPVAVTLAVRSGRRVIARRTFTAIAAGTTRRLVWRTPALARRDRRLVVLATSLDTASGVPTGSVATLTR